jgi:hypothetical protein
MLLPYSATRYTNCEDIALRIGWGEISIQDCPRRSTFLNTVSDQRQLEQRTEEIINNIKGAVYHDAQLVKRQSTMKVIKTTSGVPYFRTIPAEQRVAVLPKADFHSLGYPMGEVPRGVYDGVSGKIFLNQELWCLQPLIHETLHSISFFAARSDLRAKLHWFVEGLTDLLSGYVLFQCYGDDCHQDWVAGPYRYCSLQCYEYCSSVTLLASMCRVAKLRIRDLANLYFWDGTADWESRYDKFLSDIRHSGRQKFRDFCRDQTLTLEVSLRDECTRAFGSEFEEIIRSPLRSCVDFNEIPF